MMIIVVAVVDVDVVAIQLSCQTKLQLNTPDLIIFLDHITCNSMKNVSFYYKFLRTHHARGMLSLW